MVRQNGNDMSGKVCLVTGATSGIGEACALLLARQKATVILVGRNRHKCVSTTQRIRRATGNEEVDFLLADLSARGEIHSLASQLESRYQRLDVLINNAGARILSRSVSADGFEMTFALNYLAPFLLSHLLLPLLLSSKGRIINVASSAHRDCAGIDFDDLQSEHDYDGKKAYAQSKLAVLLFTYELDRFLKGSGVAVNAVDPGNVASGFSRNNGWISLARHLVGSLLSGGLSGPMKGAQCPVYLAGSPNLAGVSGRYFFREKEINSSDSSYDADSARRLWEISRDLTGCKFPAT